jgi:hypothetical protein
MLLCLQEKLPQLPALVQTPVSFLSRLVRPLCSDSCAQFAYSHECSIHHMLFSPSYTEHSVANLDLPMRYENHAEAGGVALSTIGASLRECSMDNARHFTMVSFPMQTPPGLWMAHTLPSGVCAIVT